MALKDRSIWGAIGAAILGLAGIALIGWITFGWLLDLGS